MVVAAVGLVGGCRSGGSEDAFCAQLAVVRDAGPLFPARTDGEPVPDHDVVELLGEAADAAPEEIREEMGVLAEVAQELAADADRRRTNGSSSPSSGRWSRSVVESAQRATVRYAEETCDIDLTQATAPAGETDVENRPSVLQDD